MLEKKKKTKEEKNEKQNFFLRGNKNFKFCQFHFDLELNNFLRKPVYI